jgi:2-hydroxy-3-oxopropionate reductase
MSDLRPRVGVIGNGVMGSAIAERLVREGAGVLVYDADRTKSRALVNLGAVQADSPATLAANVEFVITSLNTADIVESVVFGTDGIALAGSPEKLLIDMSSIDPQRTTVMSARLVAERGMGWVDAPLSGGAPAAATGRLTLLLGGTQADVERAEPVLSLLSANRTLIGASGAGQTAKLVNQILCAFGFMAVAEAVRFASDNGVDATRIPAALAGGRADSRILQEFMAKMARRDFSPTGRIDNMLKDLESVQRLALERRTPMPITGLITELHRMLVAGGLGGADNAEYVRLFDLAAAAPEGRDPLGRGRPLTVD